MKKTKAVATCGIICALSCVAMYIGSATQVFDLSACIFAALLIIPIYIEYGTGYAMLIFAVTSVTSLLILPYKFPAALYLCFAGYYPVLKAFFERRGLVLSWILKLLTFNATLTALIVATRYIAVLEYESITLDIVVYALANVVFVITDLLATRLITLYMIKYRPALKRRGLI
ncbi:MAG TPA: hypothetical protein PLZ27_00090 [Bacillota bacterium]|nr:hypothetical protein [Clostridiales bacterium]HPU17055.1 hypothetical protein [Bacillota bacterium]